MMARVDHFRQFRSRGFSLLEVLIAVFILGIGLIMVASVFPVGANWTKQGVEQGVSQTVALNALSVIQSHYGPQSLDANHKPGSANAFSTILSTKLVPLPGFVGTNGIPVAERCFQYGNPQPFPATNPAACIYYWTAMTRATNGSTSGTSHDLYIFVFRKGNPTDTFTIPSSATVDYPAGASEETVSPSNSVRNQGTADAGIPALYQIAWEPTLVKAAYMQGTYNAAFSPPVQNMFPRIGVFGVGETSGTVFRQTLSIDYTNLAGNTKAVAQPGVVPTENVISALPADGSGQSPLIYVYQTTVPY